MSVLRSVRKLRLLILALLLSAVPASSFAGIFISVNIAPPPLPFYSQPFCPGDGYIWTPGYWAYGPEGYYWVPGTWVMAPQVGFLWTPGYWGWGGGHYLWNGGYWGHHVGYYGGVNYGFGYVGVGFVGGRWDGDRFAYNRAVTNVNVTNVRNVYVDKTVINNTTIINNNRASFNGPGGVNRQPLPQEQAAAREQHLAPVAAQATHEQAAATNRGNLFAANHGRPAMAAVTQPMGMNRAGTPNASDHTPAPLAANRGAAPNALNNSTVRPANPAGNGTRPLITAQHPNSGTPNNLNNGSPRPNGGNINQQVQPNNGNRAPYNQGSNQRGTPNVQQPYNAPPRQQAQQYHPAPQPQYHPQPQPQYHPAPQPQQHAAPPAEHGGGGGGQPRGNERRR